ncbi:hypothetical protein ASD30_03515 [Nocardioides sp. Root140]|nr:hypothetical protein ASD30_03515 [Nocardioides sp. Root140]
MWNIVLTADLGAHVPQDLPQRLRDLNLELGGVPGTAPIVGEIADLRRRLALTEDAPVTVGHDAHTIVISAHHHYLDGLGLLAAFSRLTGRAATSSARGVGDRAEAVGARVAQLRRLAEVALTPPARIPASGSRDEPWDSFVEVRVPGRVGTTDLVVAGTRAAELFSLRRGRRRAPRHTAVAVGASRTGGAEATLQDNSALLRLRNTERLGPVEVGAALRSQPTESVTATGRDSAGGGSAARLATRILAPRLGSTLLVSHLGTVTAADVAGFTFHPVTGGGTGISIGAVTHAGTTTLSARGRARRHGEEALSELLRLLVESLPGSTELTEP